MPHALEHDQHSEKPTNASPPPRRSAAPSACPVPPPPGEASSPALTRRQGPLLPQLPSLRKLPQHTRPQEAPSLQIPPPSEREANRARPDPAGSCGELWHPLSHRSWAPRRNGHILTAFETTKERWRGAHGTFHRCCELGDNAKALPPIYSRQNGDNTCLNLTDGNTLCPHNFSGTDGLRNIGSTWGLTPLLSAPRAAGLCPRDPAVGSLCLDSSLWGAQPRSQSSRSCADTAAREGPAPLSA